MGIKSNPLSEKQQLALHDLLKDITQEQLIWLDGYFEGRFAGADSGNRIQNKTEEIPLTEANLTIIYGTETGNAKSLADKLAEKAAFKGVKSNVVNMYDFDAERLQEEENLAVIVSTHGEGDPPDMAEEFYNFITEEDATRLENLSYSVLALGDKSYKNYCQTGENIDLAIRELGGFRITPLVKCDVDYEMDAEVWMNNLLVNLKPAEKDEQAEEENNEEQAKSAYSKKNPYKATILEKIKITGNDSEKEVYHLELSLDDSGITYEPGDSVGIFTKNPASLIDRIFDVTGFSRGQKVDVNEEEFTLFEALTFHLEITVLSFDLLQKYFEKTKNQELGEMLQNEKLLDEYLFGHDLLDLLEDFPYNWNAGKLVEILRPMPPRLYSISSSQEHVGNQVHAIVSVVRYERKNRLRLGACSSYLAENIDVDDRIPIYIDKNPSFKLPQNGSKIIMVGAGTGIAPYRAFLQHREQKGIKGNSWLFFGDRNFKSDFLYQTDWQNYMETNQLEKMDVAFSRDQKEKVYVQHKLWENQQEIYKWIEEGASVYLCGDMKKMAKDVNKTLLEIIQTQGGISEEHAMKYIKKLKKEKRFQQDIY